MSDFFEKLKKGMGSENSLLQEGGQPAENKSVDREPEVKEQKKPRKPRKKKENVQNTLPASGDKIKETSKKMEKETAKKILIEAAYEEKSAMPQEEAEITDNKNWFEPEGQLTIDVYQTENEIVIQSAVAGVRPENLDILIENDIVSIKGERKETAEKEKKNYFYQECYWGKFSREIILPCEVDSSRAQAKMKDGVLTIRIPKIDKERKRKISVNP